MSLKDIDMDAALRRLAERRIEEAMREGKFSNLKGAGQPIDLEPAPADENARLAWWALRILKQNDVVPEEVKWRKRIDTLKSMLDKAEDERAMRVLVGQINDLVRRLNTLGTNAINIAMTPVDLETELRKLHERLMPAPRLDVQNPRPAFVPMRDCINKNCKARNPITAAYCRRCGGALT
jgi:hypothetical protein